MTRFYAPDIETSGMLPEVESTHCCRVLRMREDDPIEVVDGKGFVYECIITAAHPKHTSVSIKAKKGERLHWGPQITLAIAPTKNIDRMEWLVEKAVEIGINRIVFLNCTHSVRRIIKRERIEKIIVSAMKQSLKAHMPLLDDMTDFSDFIKREVNSLKYMGYCDESAERKEFAREYDGNSDVTILIGPEGDFTHEEVELALESGYCPVTFGNTRMRTETAALYALCAAHTIINAR